MPSVLTLGYETAVMAACLLACAVGVAAAIRHRLGWYTGIVMAVLSCVLCMVCARGYYLLVAGPGFRFRLFPDVPYDYAFGGGVLGFLLALVLTAALCRKPFSRVADCFAPVGLLGIAAVRMAEALSDFGWGDMVDAAWMQRYPFAIQNMYEEWCAAVFNLEALFALLILLAILLCGKKLMGMRLQTGLVWWAVTQIFCESLRVESIVWGFVRVQQLLSAIILLVVLLLGTKRLPRGKRKHSVSSWIGFAIGCGAVIFLEYAIDKMPWATWINYAAMAAVLLMMGCCAQRLIRPAPAAEEVVA